MTIMEIYNIELKLNQFYIQVFILRFPFDCDVINLLNKLTYEQLNFT